MGGEEKAVDEVTNQIEGRAQDEAPIEAMSVRVAPIERAPRDDSLTEFGRIPPDDVGEMLAHLQGGEPTQLTQEEEVGGEDGQRVEEKVEPLPHQILAWQHP